MFTMLSLVLASAANVLDAAFYALYIVLIARLVMNFYVEGGTHPAVVFVFKLTELILDPVRQKLSLEPRPADGALLVVFFSLIFIQGIIVGMIRHLSVWITS